MVGCLGRSINNVNGWHCFGALVGPIGDKAAVLCKARGRGRVYSTVGV
jgi:hypothetical protein